MTHPAHAPSTPPLPPAAVDRLADEIAELSSHIDAATHRLLALIRRFDEGSGWATHGALSCAHWLNWRIGLDLGAARERVRVARALGALPVVDDALRRGAISYSKTRAITRVATRANEATLLEMAHHATASQMERICRGYRRVLVDQQPDRPESLADEEQRRFVRFGDTDDGMVRIDARLRPEEARVILQALDVARRRAWRSGNVAATVDVSAETSASVSRPDIRGNESWPKHAHTNRHEDEPAPALSRADALVAVAEAFLSSEAEGRARHGAGAAPVELVVHVDAAALRDTPHTATDSPDPTLAHATLDDGTALQLATAQRLACDAAVVTLSHDAHGDVRTLTRRTRRISATLRRALRVRDDGCRFPGCSNRLTDAHHVVAWARGGATTLANLCSLCRRHHRFVHEHGYRVETAPGGELRFFRRDGTLVPTAGTAPSMIEVTEAIENSTQPRGGDGTGTGTTIVDDAANTRTLIVLRDVRAAHDLPAIDARTAFPRWDGTPVDYGLAVNALMASEVAGESPTA